MALPTANKNDGKTRSVGVKPNQAACSSGEKGRGWRRDGPRSWLARRAQAAVLHADQPEREALRDFRGAIARAIVHHDDLLVGMALRQRLLQRLRQPAGGVVDGNDDTDGGQF